MSIEFLEILWLIITGTASGNSVDDAKTTNSSFLVSIITSLKIIRLLLFYNLITLLSLVMSMNDDHARIGILIVLPLFDGWGESAFPILICLIPELAPTAYMFVYLFWSTISIPAKWPSNVNRTVFSSLSTWAE